MSERKLTREDLIEILSMDGTYQEMLEAIESKELTQEEHDNILNFLEADSREKANEAFEKVLANIEAAPVYDTGKEERKAWKDYRKDVAHNVKEINDLKLHYEDLVKDGQAEIASLVEKYGDSYSGLEEAKQIWGLEFNQRELVIKTNQESALALLDAEAKSFQAQALARERRERLEPIMNWVKDSWSHSTEAVRSFVDAQKLQIERYGNTTKAINRASDAGFHPIKDFVNKQNMKNAMHELKNVNQAKANIKKVENELLERANKVLLSEYKKEHAFDNLKSMLKGQKVDMTGPEQIQDIDRAVEVLANDGFWSRRALHNAEKDLKKYQEMQEKSQNKLDIAMERVQSGIDERRREVKEIYKDVQQQLQDGKLSQDVNKLERIGKELENALHQTQFGKDLLSDEMMEYLKTLGKDDYIAGQEIDLDDIEFDR